ncbi:MAG: hypothetical protein WBP08_10205 [Saprospiraceae bacterium]
MTITITFNQDQKDAVLNYMHQYHISIDALITYIKKSFIKASKLLGVKDRISKCTIAITNSTSSAGSYDNELSSESVFFFTVNVSYVFSCMQGHNEKLYLLWIHELAHAIDNEELSLFSKLMQKYEIDWAGRQILDALVCLRHEGFATLVQELYGSDLAKFNMIPDAPFDYFNQVFIGYYDSILNQQIEIFDFSLYSFQEIGGLYKWHAYLYGRQLVINALYYKYEHYRPVITAIATKIQKGLPISINDFQGLPVLFDFSKISTSEFIFINMQTRIGLPFPDRLSLKILFMVRLFYKYDHSLLKAVNSKEYYAYAHFLESILKGRNYLNPMDFEYFIPTKIMEDASIVRLYVNYEKSLPDGIFKDLLNKVYTRWLTQKDELSYWQLSYVFQSDDIIEEYIPFIGHIDDMMVLDL